MATSRPPFIIRAADVPERSHVYPHSDEQMAPSRALGRRAGLHKIGIHLIRLPPGRRTSWPHAEEHEEEFAYVIEGEVDCWIDGDLHRLQAGDLVAWPAGTGIAHTVLNNGTREAVLLSGGQTSIAGSRITYPLNPSRREDMTWSDWWDDAPKRVLGSHDGLPDVRRAALLAGKVGGEADRAAVGVRGRIAATSAATARPSVTEPPRPTASAPKPAPKPAAKSAPAKPATKKRGGSARGASRKA